MYTINKGINKPIEFKGLKAQYIGYLGVGLIGLLVLFAILYIIGVHPFVCLLLIVLAATWLFTYVYRLSRRYGPHGMTKKIARRKIPAALKCYSRRIYLNLNTSRNECSSG